jgi:hypothetical protein
LGFRERGTVWPPGGLTPGRRLRLGLPVGRDGGSGRLRFSLDTLLITAFRERPLSNSRFSFSAILEADKLASFNSSQSRSVSASDHSLLAKCATIIEAPLLPRDNR